MNVECKLQLDLELVIQAHAHKYVPATRYSPEEPEHIDEVVIKAIRLNNVEVPISAELSEAIYDAYMMEIEEHIMDYITAETNKAYESMAEDLLDAAMYRHDCLTNR